MLLIPAVARGIFVMLVLGTEDSEIVLNCNCSFSGSSKMGEGSTGPGCSENIVWTPPGHRVAGQAGKANPCR